MKSMLLICLFCLYSLPSNAQKEIQSSTKTSIKVQLENNFVKVTIAVISTSYRKEITQFSKHLSGQNYKAIQKIVTLPSGKRLQVLEIYFQRDSFSKIEPNTFLLT